MSERSNFTELDPQWMQEMEEGIVNVIASYTDPQDHDLPGHRIVDFTPNSMGVDGRYEYSQLTHKEKTFIRTILYRELKFNPDVAEIVNSQEVEVPNATIPGIRKETIFKTSRPVEDELFVHVVTFVESGEVDGWFIAPRDFVL